MDLFPCKTKHVLILNAHMINYETMKSIFKIQILAIDTINQNYKKGLIWKTKKLPTLG